MKQETTSWFRRGDDVFAKKRELDKIAKVKKEKSVSRFFLKAGEESIIVFVDSVPVGIFEHNLRIDGRWGNFYTCSKDVGVCPICQYFRDNKPTWTVYFTVIDTRSFVRQSDGQEVKNRKVLFPVKGSAIALVEKLLKKYKNLSGLAFKVTRLTDNDPNCGNDFEYLGKVNILKKFGQDAVIPIDYDKVLAFPTEEELAYLGITAGSLADEVDLPDDKSVEKLIDELVDEKAEEEDVDKEIDIEDLV